MFTCFRLYYTHRERKETHFKSDKENLSRPIEIYRYSLLLITHKPILSYPITQHLVLFFPRSVAQRLRMLPLRARTIRADNNEMETFQFQIVVIIVPIRCIEEFYFSIDLIFLKIYFFFFEVRNACD